MRILVIGDGRRIWPGVVDAYLAAGHHVFVADDPSRGRRENLSPDLPLCEINVCLPDLAAVFDEVKPEVVNCHTAQVSLADEPQRTAMGECRCD